MKVLNLFVAVSSLTFVCGQVKQANNWWSLNLIDLNKYPDAKCLDGSAAGFWKYDGYSSGKDKFFIHHQGGGWCINDEDCYQRSLMNLGSSITWENSVDCYSGSTAQPCSYDGNDGMQSADPTENKLMYNWNKIFVGYCDGASFSGHVLSPINGTGSSDGVDYEIHYKGRYILDAIYDTLLNQHELNKASDIVISGGSAGGLSIYLHIDYLHDLIHSTNPSARVVGVADAGFFMDLPSIHGDYLYTPNYKNVFHMQNVSDSVNSDCVAHHATIVDAEGVSESWKCFMAQYTLPFIHTPLFITNDLNDWWQGQNIMGLTCEPWSSTNPCSEDELLYLNNYRQSMLDSSLGAYMKKHQSGVWLPTCWQHTLIDWAYSWDQLYVGEKNATNTMRSLFHTWYTTHGGGVRVGGEYDSSVC